MRATIRRWLVGHPLPTSQLIHERITKVKGLAVFASDALSSNAYATEEILLGLMVAGAGALWLSLPVAVAISTVLAIVAFSYYQTIHAYPSGGGAYIVAHDNLGLWPGLVAAAALLIDYVLTVAVSIASGIAAITSAVPEWFVYRVPLAVGAIAVVAIINLRGVRESANVFALPTYLFIGGVGVMIVAGLIRSAGQVPIPPRVEADGALVPLSLSVVLRAFAAGSAAMTGVEAISNGIPAFRPPESRNAGTTLTWMAGILITLFLGLTVLARQFGIVPAGHETVVSQIARTVFGTGPMYYLVQVSTALILVLAANTSFADFPRLSSILARDGFLPRQLANLGDRLVFANGIILLALLSGVLVVIFRASTHALIPLYAVGVFLSFTLSQAGMVKRWWKLRARGWVRSLIINGIGAAATTVMVVVVVAAKFTQGAWIVLLLIPLDVWIMYRVYHHYQEVRSQLSLEGARLPEPIRRHKVVVPVAGMHRGVLNALRYAKSLSDDVVAVIVDIDPRRTKDTQEKWERWSMDVPLKVLPSPYRSLNQPLIRYLDNLEWEIGFDQQLTLVLPEFVPAKWWHFFLHGQNALLLKLALYFRRREGHRVTIVTDVPYYLQLAAPIVERVPAPPLQAYVIGTLVLLFLAAIGLGLAILRSWSPLTQGILGIATVILLGVITFLLIVRSIFSLR